VPDEAKPCVCTPHSTLIFACSGAADVGEISDRAARKLSGDRRGKMFCLAGLGGNVEPIIAATKAAEKIVAIDGCALDCVKCCLQRASLDNFVHFRVTDLGMKKGDSPPTEQRINQVAQKAGELAAGER